MRLTFGSESPGEGLTGEGGSREGLGGGGVQGVSSKPTKQTQNFPRLGLLSPCPGTKDPGSHKTKGPGVPCVSGGGGQSKAAVLIKEKKKNLCECLLLTRDGRQEHWQLNSPDFDHIILKIVTVGIILILSSLLWLIILNILMADCHIFAVCCLELN